MQKLNQCSYTRIWLLTNTQLPNPSPCTFKRLQLFVTNRQWHYNFIRYQNSTSFWWFNPPPPPPQTLAPPPTPNHEPPKFNFQNPLGYKTRYPSGILSNSLYYFPYPNFAISLNQTNTKKSHLPTALITPKFHTCPHTHLATSSVFRRPKLSIPPVF